MTLMIYPRHIWNVQYNARSNRGHPPTPNIAPATKNGSHDWCSSMTCPVQCAEHQKSSSNTKYCTCHDKWHPMISENFLENDWNVICNAGAIQTWSNMIRVWSDHEPVSPQPAAELRLLFALTARILYIKCNISRSGYHSTFHQVLPLPRKVTVELHQILHLPGRLNVQLHQILRLPRKVTVELHQILHLPRKLSVQLECNVIKYWPATKILLFFDSTILWLSDLVRISEVSQLPLIK